MLELVDLAVEELVVVTLLEVLELVDLAVEELVMVAQPDAKVVAQKSQKMANSVS